MATKNTRDNTYYSFTKAFRFASFIVLIAPVLQLIWWITLYATNGGAGWAYDAAKYTSIVSGIFAILWIVTNIIMIIFAGNMRGIKSPLLIRILLIIALALVLSGAIVYLLFIYGKISYDNTTGLILAIVLPILEMIGYIIGAVLGGKIQKALRTK